MVCGTNDVAKNEANEALTLITETLDRATNTNIILVDLPHRYDLASWSCVNKEVEKTNKRLEELSGKYSNVTLVKSSKAERALHTRQGLHLNFWGKKWLAEVVAKAITAKKDPNHRLCLRDVQPPPPGYTALHLAVKWKKAKLVYHLCKNSDNTQLKDFINCRDNDGNTPLHLAVISRSKDVIVELLKFEELNINAKNFVSQTPLALVWGKNDTDAKLIQEILLASKADPLLIKFVNESEEGSEDEEDDSQEDYLPLTYYEDMAYPSPTVSEDESEDSEDDDDDSHEDHTPDCENVDYPSLIESEDESEEEDSEQDDDSHEDSSPMADYGEVTSYTVVRRRHLQVDVKRD
ncbi:glutamic acid-rich protein-like [Homalodisca vitripennis]|uniref:glutamic acid-rich protein-like n=1 Tax=Homalodisca vitripennis TaxID=197043 RepID=UPI001EEB7D7B|nr:glutamic acid-rich protein-like [Homalodisca vitripennis]